MTAFGVQLGTLSSAPGQILLGGIGQPGSFAQTLPPQALPLLAHVYASDGVTYLGSPGPLVNRPQLKWTLNGGFHPIQLELADTSSWGRTYGSMIYGTGTYGGFTQGNIVRLTEQGGDGRVIYTGIVENLLDEISADGHVSHQLCLTPLVAELGDAYLNFNYSVATDVAQMVRDAVRQSIHCSFNEVSIPISTGTVAINDFNYRPATDVLDFAIKSLGSNWYWFCDCHGIVWLQPMSSTAAYSAVRGQDYQSRKSNASIADLKNFVIAIGDPPPQASSPTVATYSGSSQATYGIRALSAPIHIPGVTDQATLQAVANTVGALFDRVIHTTELQLLPSFGRRVNPAQPGGPTLRFLEPNVNSLVQSETGSGVYQGPYLTVDLELDGSAQKVIAADAPVVNVQDLQQEITRIVSRTSLDNLVYTPSALNVKGTYTAGAGLQTAADPAPGQASPARWVLDTTSFRCYDGTANVYGAPSGPGVVVEIGSNGQAFIGGGAAGLLQFLGPQALIQVLDPNRQPRVQIGNLQSLGVSPAQWGFRAIDAGNNPIFDSQGLIAVMQQLGQVHGGPATVTAVSGSDVVLTDGTNPASVTFTLARQARVLLIAMMRSQATTGSGTVLVFIDGTWDGLSSYCQWDPSTLFSQETAFWSQSLASGSHTLTLRGSVVSSGATLTVNSWDMWVFLLGT